MTKQELTETLRKNPQVWGFLEEAQDFAKRKNPGADSNKIWGETTAYLVAIARWLN